MRNKIPEKGGPPMRKVTPSQKMRKEIEAVLEGTPGEFNGQGILEEIIRKGAALVLQEMLEQEVTEFLGRGYYQRGGGIRKGYRNGYEPYRIKTAEGEITVYKPQVRDTEEPFKSKLAQFFKKQTDVLEKLALEMYVRGLSTRDIEDALFEATGDVFLSKSSVSKITEELNQEYEKFQGRDLSVYEVEYLFLDAIYESIGARYNVKGAILCAWGITRGGRKVLLSLGLGKKESYTAWLEFLRDMVRRGLRAPTTVTTDGAPGLIRAVEEVFPDSLRVRCWFHKMQNLSNKAPDEEWEDIKGELIAIRDAASWEMGKKLAEAFCEKYASKYPSLVRCLREDLEATLNHLRVPVRHRKSVRTTNLVERSFEEERRRSKVIPQFLTEKAALKLVFGVLMRASRRWRRVRFTERDLEYLDKLRKELGLEVEEEEVVGV